MLSSWELERNKKIIAALDKQKEDFDKQWAIWTEDEREAWRVEFRTKWEAEFEKMREGWLE